jgi:hypothetical protein
MTIIKTVNINPEKTRLFFPGGLPAGLSIGQAGGAL